MLPRSSRRSGARVGGLRAPMRKDLELYRGVGPRVLPTGRTSGPYEPAHAHPLPEALDGIDSEDRACSNVRMRGQADPKLSTSILQTPKQKRPPEHPLRRVGAFGGGVAVEGAVAGVRRDVRLDGAALRPAGDGGTAGRKFVQGTKTATYEPRPRSERARPQVAGRDGAHCRRVRGKTGRELARAISRGPRPGLGPRAMALRASGRLH